jgi:hypothetical protein
VVLDDDSGELPGPLRHGCQVAAYRDVMDVFVDDGASVVVLLMYAAGTMRLEVRDHDPLKLPLLQNPAPTDTGGRGLLVVQALSDRWGIRVTETGKAVWCELAVTGPAARGGRPATGRDAGHGA